MNSRFNTSVRTRPTGHRLLVALGVASLVVVTVLALCAVLLDSRLPATSFGAANDDYLAVYIKRRALEPGSETTDPNRELAGKTRASKESVPANRTSTQDKTVSVSPPEPRRDSISARDWNSMARKSARETVNDRFRQEVARESAWRQTRSVMFEPDGHFDIKEQQPLMAAVRFRPHVGVLGLGVTLGSCFFGLPLIGVPLEKRSTTGLTLVVCADAG